MHTQTTTQVVWSAHTNTHTDTLSQTHRQLQRAGGKMSVRACVRTKSFLITHLSHEMRSAYFIRLPVAWLIQHSSASCSLCVKLFPFLCLHFYLCPPPTPHPSLHASPFDRPLCGWGDVWATSPCKVAIEAAGSSWGSPSLTQQIGCQSSMSADYDGAISVAVWWGRYDVSLLQTFT